MTDTELSIRDGSNVVLPNGNGDDGAGNNGNAAGPSVAPSTGTYYACFSRRTGVDDEDYRFVVLVAGRPVVAPRAMSESKPNDVAGDGCNRFCGVERGYDCHGEPSVCTPTGSGGGGGEGAGTTGPSAVDDEGGCGCRLVNRTSSHRPAALVLLGLLALGARRRRSAFAAAHAER